MYRRELSSGIVIQSMQAEYADQLGAMQELVFPTLAREELMRPEHYRYHVEMFPEGQFIALDGEQVVGSSSSIRVNFDFENPYHTFADFLANGWMSRHEPEGVWLYGMDMSVHPDYRRRGIAKALYQARQEYAVRPLRLKGQLIGGMLRGYGAVQDQLAAEDYYQQVIQGQTSDPTITPQMRVGFEPLVLLPNYLNDPICANYGVLLKLDASQNVMGE